MQHPDEGTIHSWLDGALPAAEAAKLEAHVTACPACAAAVAEARGFIAASSRILIALDDVPRGVLPAIPERKRDLRVFWRAAAAMLVVAGGSIVVMRQGGTDARLVTTEASPAMTSVPSAVRAPAAPEADEGAVSLTAPGSTDALAAAAGAAASAPSRTANAPARPTSGARRSRTPVAVSERDFSQGATRTTASEPLGRIDGGTSAADAASAPAAVASQRIANVEAVETSATPLKLVKVERAIGVRRTTYEVSPAISVVLTEPEGTFLSGVVVTGAATAAKPEVRLRGANTPQASRAEVAAAAAPPPPPALLDSQRRPDSASARDASAAKAAVERAAVGTALTAAPNSISWTETATGRTLTLSGSLPVERLQEIRKQIERERAAARAKTP